MPSKKMKDALRKGRRLEGKSERNQIDFEKDKKKRETLGFLTFLYFSRNRKQHKLDQTSPIFCDGY